MIFTALFIVKLLESGVDVSQIWVYLFIGTYGARDRLSDETECTPCAGGYGCPIEGMIKVTDHLCKSGFFCTEGSDTTTPDGVNNAGEFLFLTLFLISNVVHYIVISSSNIKSERENCAMNAVL